MIVYIYIYREREEKTYIYIYIYIICIHVYVFIHSYTIEYRISYTIADSRLFEGQAERQAAAMAPAEGPRPEAPDIILYNII